MRNKVKLSEPRHDSVGASGRCARAIAAMALAILSISPVHADVIKSDTITINFGGLNQTYDVPEVVIDGKDQAESKLVIDLSQATGFIGGNGYILLCEPPMKARVGCGPGNKFKGVSDILVRGLQTGNNNKPGLFFFSDPFSEDGDAMPILKALYGNQPIPDPRGPITGILETGGPQEVGRYFGFDDPKAIIITSDADPAPAPEPSTIALFGAGIMAVAMSGLLRQSRR